MSLEFHIYGPGFGETLFLRWPREGGGWRGGLVDAHSDQDGVWLAAKLAELELTELEFVIATHPHLDHINNFAAGLECSEVRVLRGFFWPPFMDSSWIRFFDRLAAQEKGELSKTAEMIRQWFGYWSKQFKVKGIASCGMEGRSDFRIEYSTEIRGCSLMVRVIGPWDAINTRLSKNVVNSKGRLGRIHYEHRYANDVSIALLIEYGAAQVVLGGDMEDTNWSALKRESNRPKFKPSLVKVSHHGSENGQINEMWPKSGGFFDGKPENAVAVVTPWRQAARGLPNGDRILNRIRDAGFVVYVTGQGGHRYRNPDSHVSVRIDSNGAATVLDQTSDVRKL